MPFVTVKPKFQVTIPAKLRRHIDLREGDIMEASLHGDAIVLRPRAVVDRHEAAERIAGKFAALAAPEAMGPSEDEILKKAIAEIDRSRRERRAPKS